MKTRNKKGICENVNINFESKKIASKNTGEYKEKMNRFYLSIIYDCK